MMEIQGFDAAFDKANRIADLALDGIRKELEAGASQGELAFLHVLAATRLAAGGLLLVPDPAKRRELFAVMVREIVESVGHVTGYPVGVNVQVVERGKQEVAS